MDDSTIVGDDVAAVISALQATTQILSDLGFIVHPDNSVLIPTQSLNLVSP